MPDAEGQALGNLGLAYTDLGEAHQAIEYFEQHIEIAREIEDLRGEANSLYGKAMDLDTHGDCARAIQLLESALDIFEQIEGPQADRTHQTLEKWREG